MSGEAAFHGDAAALKLHGGMPVGDGMLTPSLSVVYLCLQFIYPTLVFSFGAFTGV